MTQKPTYRRTLYLVGSVAPVRDGLVEKVQSVPALYHFSKHAVITVQVIQIIRYQKDNQF